MKIKDLPEDIKKLAIANQIAQGNKTNEELEISLNKFEGNFIWDLSIEGYDFWQSVSDEMFEDARNLLANPDQEELKMEYIIVLDPDQINCSLIENDHNFLEIYDSYDDAKSDAELWKRNGDCKSYGIYQRCRD